MAALLLPTILPLAIAFIMFSLGLGLTFADFARVLARPGAVALGLAAQILAIPLTAFLLLQVVPLQGDLALGVMILAFCPGGATSNILTRLARADVALSITLTALAALLSVLTVPPFTALAAAISLGDAAPRIDVLGLALAMFAITTVPVLLGLAIARLAPAFTARAEPWVSRAAVTLFIVIVVGAIAANWAVVVENLPSLGPILIGLNVILLALGVALGRAAGLDRPGAVAVAMELGIQNGTLGIAVGGQVAGGASVLPPFSLPSGGYGITMYVVAFLIVAWSRRWIRAAPAGAPA